VASLNDAGLLRAFAVAHFPCAELRNAALEQVALLEKGTVQPPPATRDPPAPLATAPATTAPALPATTPEPALLPPVPEGPDPEVILAAQTELKRLGCYRGAIDGDWGKGSRAALARFREIARLPAPPDVEEPTPETLALLRRPENAKCPAPPAPVAKARPAARTTTGAAAKPAATAPAEAPAPKKKCGKLILLPFPAPIDMC
jgi:peptidoglycan hydrolase-like protein with peptidoglycan-binding domain